MTRFKATDTGAPLRVKEGDTGDVWVLVRKNDSRDNFYQLVAEFYFTRLAVYGEAIYWKDNSRRRY